MMAAEESHQEATMIYDNDNGIRQDFEGDRGRGQSRRDGIDQPHFENDSKQSHIGGDLHFEFRNNCVLSLCVLTL